MSKLQTCQRRLLQLLLLGLILWLIADLEQRQKAFSWLVIFVALELGLVLLLESSRSLCRTPTETLKLLAQVCFTVSKTLMQYTARGFKPKFPKWTLRFELVRSIMRDAANMFGRRIVDEDQAPIFRWHSEVFGSLLGWFACKKHGLRIEPVVVDGLEHLWLKESSAESRCLNNRKRLVVLFYHGGGYAVLSPRMYIPFCCNLLTTIKKEIGSQLIGDDAIVDVFLANYRKVPEYSFPAPVEDAVAMYEYLLQHEKVKSSQIILVGDSAGGGLVMSTLLRVRDGKSSWKVKLPLPLAAIVACPLVDLTGDEDKSKGQHCVLSPSIIAASIESYRPNEDPTKWADASPVQCNLQGLPPILLQAASFDYLFDHSLRLAAKAKADGVTNWEVDIHEGVTHVFMVFPGYVLPYARIGVHRMAVFAAKLLLAENARDKHSKLTADRKVEDSSGCKSAPSAAA